ncbi:MAG: hypothetical protein WA913_14195 [Pricia sp.]
MNTKNFTYLLQHPNKVVSPMQTKQLEEVLEEFPYFQTAHALHLKGLKNLNSFKYNKALKVTAAYTADREVLFDLITSKEFQQNRIADTLTGKSTKAATASSSDDGGLSLSKEEADALLDPELFTAKDPSTEKSLSEAERKASEELEIGEPLPFSKKEKYSFGEWLQLTSFKQIRRKKGSESGEREIEDIHFPIEEEEEDPRKRKQSDLIDKFIAENPKIKPQKDVPKIAIGDSAKFDQKELMTETLAKVYLEQKKYKKAIQAYKILSLKYPEKSGFFADRIKAVERLKEDDS